MVEKNIAAAVDSNRDEIIGHLAALVRIPSRTGEEGAAQEHVASRYRALGLSVDVWEPDVRELFEKYPDVAQYPSHWEHDLILPYDELPSYEALLASGRQDVLNYRGRPNVVGVWKGTGGGRSLVLNSHIDTVTVDPVQSWTADPFSGAVQGELMYGRGTSDCKGGVVAAIEAVRCLQSLGVRLRGDVILESVVNEEHAGNGTLACIARGYLADAVISGEPSDNKIRLGSSGGVYWGIELTGRVLHTKSRWEGDELRGVSAIEKLAPVIDALLAMEAELNRRPTSGLYAGSKPLSLTLGRVWGGSYDTASAGSCTLRGSIYFGPDLGSVGDVIREVKRRIGECAEQDPWLKKNPPGCLFYHHDDAHRMEADAEIVRVIGNAAEKTLGEQTAVIVGMAANDCRHQVNKGKMPAAVFGPGTGNQAHTTNESIRTGDLLDNVKVLATVICDWCG